MALGRYKIVLSRGGEPEADVVDSERIIRGKHHHIYSLRVFLDGNVVRVHVEIIVANRERAHLMKMKEVITLKGEASDQPPELEQET